MLSKLTDRTQGRAWRTVFLLAIAYLLNYIDRQVIFSIFPVLKTELGLTDAQLGLTGTVFTWVYSLAMPFSGRLADVVRRDRQVFASLLLWSAATCGTGLSHSLASLLFWRGLMGVTESLYFPAALGLIAELHPGASRSKALAVHTVAQFAGITVGGWYGGWAAEHVGWREGFLLLTAAGIGYGLALRPALARLGAPVPGARTTRAAPRDVLRSRSYLALTAAFFGFCMMLWVVYAWLPTFIYDRLHLSLSASGLLATAYVQGGAAGGVLLGGVAGDWSGTRWRGGRFYVGGVGLLLCTPMAALLFAAPSPSFLKLCCAGFGLLGGTFIANVFAAAYDVISPRNFGLATGGLNLAGGFAGGAGILAAGMSGQSQGIAGLMQWTAAATAASALLLLAVVWFSFDGDRRRAAPAGA